MVPAFWIFESLSGLCRGRLGGVQGRELMKEGALCALVALIYSSLYTLKSFPTPPKIERLLAVLLGQRSKGQADGGEGGGAELYNTEGLAK